MSSATGLETEAPPATRATPDATGAVQENDQRPRTSATAAVRDIITDYRQHGELLRQLVLRDIRLRYKEAVMGFGWALLMPVLIVLSGLIVRLAMAHYAGEPLRAQDVAAVAVKGVPWAFFVGAIGFGTASLVGNLNLVSKIYFPREVLPLAATIAQAFDLLIGSTALFAVLLVLGIPPRLTWVWVPLLTGLLVLFTAAATLFLSCANLFFRDVKYIVQVVLTFGIFFTPVLFDAAMFGELGARVIMLNPVAPLLEGMRLSVVDGHNLLRPLVEVTGRGEHVLAWSPWYLLYSGAWAVFGFVGASLMFHRLEFVFAEYV